ncbi:hypothetical protein HCH_00220 [Hahella chejuensis KCTC 2396]|uniref:Uncharacterized protein n=1 Tax=Hahella chejuensis (strain KCTC 2396) TaxID=349521 RepID=Q2SQD9_HAHCH|nr:hypothetical protein HCH_00220 [Hahella chejuensis KCTC 2396]
MRYLYFQAHSFTYGQILPSTSSSPLSIHSLSNF